MQTARDLSPVTSNLLIGATLLLALLLRVYALHGEAVWFDELACLAPLHSATGFFDYIQTVRVYDTPMTPVYFALAYVWAQVAGDSVYALRLLSVLLGMGSIVVAFYGVRRYFGLIPAHSVAALLSVSTVHIYYSQEIRMYPLVLLLAAVSGFSFLEMLRGGRRWVWAIHIAANMLLMWTHLFTVFLIAAEGLVLLAYRWREYRTWVSWGLWQVPSAALLAYWVSTIDFETLRSAASWMEVPAFRKTPELLYLYAGTRVQEHFDHARYMPGGLSPAPIITAAMAALAAWGGIVLWRKGERREECAFLVLWLALPAAALFVVSRVWEPSLVGRYTYHATLPFVVLAAVGLAGIPRAGYAKALVAGLLGLYAYQYFGVPGPLRVDWPEYVRILTNQKYPTDQLYVLSKNDLEILNYHIAQENAPREKLEAAVLAREEILPVFFKGTWEGKGSWLFVEDWYDFSWFEEAMRGAGFTVDYFSFPGGAPGLRLYHIPPGGRKE